MVNLLGPAEVRALAHELDVQPTKKLGQNFVIDPNTIRKIVAAAKIEPGETVVEIGPGLGSLTLGLCEIGAKVIAVEVDSRLASRLGQTLATFAPESEVSVIHADAMTVNELPGTPTSLVANLPYNISVPVLLHFLETFPSLRHGLVMVQAEVAHRVAAEPGSKIYGVPSLKAAWYGRWSLAGKVGRNVFWPSPNVDSALLRFEAAPWPGDESLRQRTFAAVDAAFSQRRKTLRQSLSSWAGSSAAAEAVLLRAEISPSERAERLTLAEFVALGRASV